jgi:hypothetical protein
MQVKNKLVARIASQSTLNTEHKTGLLVRIASQRPFGGTDTVLIRALFDPY